MRFLLSLSAFLFTSSVSAQENLWEATGGPYTGTVSCFLVDSSGVVFAGAEDGDVYRSADEGETWRVYASCGDRVSQFVRHPEGLLFVASHGTGIFRSSGDSSWDQVNQGLPNTDVSALAVLPDGSLLAGCSWEPGWVARSTDRGDSWVQADSGLAGHGVASLAVDGRGVVYAGTNYSGIYTSIDGGMWAAANNGISLGSTATTFLISPDSIVYAAFFGAMYYTTNGGAVWTEIRDTLLSGENLAMAAGPENALYAGTGSLLARSTDGGASWTRVHGLTTGVNSLALLNSGAILVGSVGVQKAASHVSAFSQRGLVPANVRVLVATPDSELFASASHFVFRLTLGGHWEVLPDLGYSRAAMSFACSPLGQLFVAYQEGGYLDGGILLLSGRRDAWLPKGRFNYPVMALHCDSAGILHAGTSIEGIYRSDDEGAVWTGPSLAGLQTTFITSSSPANIFAATYTGVFASTDSGVTWTDISPGLPTYDVKSLAVSPPLLLAGEFGEGVVYMSEPGSPWQRGGGFPGSSIVYGLAIVNGKAYAGTIGDGVYRCYTGIQWWEPYGLEGESVRAFAVGSDGRLYAATASLGVVRSKEGVTGVTPGEVHVPSGVSLCQNYPNPFNPGTTIRFFLPERVHAVLRVFDMLGREVATLIDEVLEPGERNVRFEANGLASGVYFYELQAGNAVETKRFTILK